MKAFFKHQPLTNKPPCDELSFWQSLRLWLSARTCSLTKNLRSAPVTLELAAGLDALRRATSNNRTYIGLLLICVAAPFAGVAYQLFDSKVIDASWYYLNNFYFFYMLSPHLSMILTLTGVFFLFPDNRRSFFLIIPIGYHVAKAVWLADVQSNDELNQIVPTAFLVMGALTSAVWLFTFSYLMSLHYHRVLGPVARLKGIKDCPDMSDSQKVQLMGRAAEELEAALKN